jgi:hypothetical protein
LLTGLTSGSSGERYSRVAAPESVARALVDGLDVDARIGQFLRVGVPAGRFDHPHVPLEELLAARLVDELPESVALLVG